MAKSDSSLTTMLYSIGVIIAIVMGIGTAMNQEWSTNAWLVLLLVVIGLVVGFYNITSKEVTPFLIGTIALVIANAVANFTILNTLIPKIGTFVAATLGNFITVIAAAAVVVAFRAVYGLAK